MVEYFEFKNDFALKLMDKYFPPEESTLGGIRHINHACGCVECNTCDTETGFKNNDHHVDASKCILHHKDIDE